MTGRELQPFSLVASIDLASLNHKESTTDDRMDTDDSQTSTGDKLINVDAPAFAVSKGALHRATDSGPISYAISMEALSLNQQAPACKVNLSEEKVSLKGVRLFYHTARWGGEVALSGPSESNANNSKPCSGNFRQCDACDRRSDDLAQHERRGLLHKLIKDVSLDSRCRGFVYLLSDGSESCPCDSFDPRMVTLDDQAGYGDKESNTFQDH